MRGTTRGIRATKGILAIALALSLVAGCPRPAPEGTTTTTTATGGGAGSGPCTECSGKCVDTGTDTENCGACGRTCAGGCEAGACKPEVLIVTPGTPTEIVLDATHIYFANLDSVLRIPIDGDNFPVEMAFDFEGTVSRLALDDTYVYWVNDDAGIVKKAALNGDGTSIEHDPGLPPGGGVEADIAVDSTNVYVTYKETGDVIFTPIFGSGATTLASGQKGVRIAVDTTYVYWSNEQPPAIMKIAVGGGSPDVLAGNLDFPGALRVFDGFAYFIDTGKIWKVATEGGQQKQLLTDEAAAADHLAVDASGVYWTDPIGTVRKVALGGGKAVTLATSTAPFSIAVDATHVYWSDFDDAAIYRIPK